MRRTHWRVTLALLAAVPASCGAAQPAGWTDRQFEFALDGMSVVDVPIREAVYKDERIRRELRRVGMTAGCRIVAAAIAQAEQARFEEYHEWALPALKAIVPAEAMTLRPGSVAPAGPYQNFGRLLLNRLKHEKPDLLPEIIDASFERALTALEPQQIAQDDWRGRFSDWDFGRQQGFPYQVACSIETSGQPERAKQPFDSLFQI